MPNIKDLYDSIPGLKKDFKIDWKEDAKLDWKIDWDNAPGPSPAAPVNTTLPAITGVAQEGETLSVSDGKWTGTLPIVYTYQWNADGAPIADATDGSYVLAAADVGTVITCTVTATNNVGTASVTTAATAEVVAAD